MARKESQETLFWLRFLYATDPMIRKSLEGLLDEGRQLAKIVTTIKKKAEANPPTPKEKERVRTRVNSKCQVPDAHDGLCGA